MTSKQRQQQDSKWLVQSIVAQHFADDPYARALCLYFGQHISTSIQVHQASISEVAKVAQSMKHITIGSVSSKVR